MSVLAIGLGEVLWDVLPDKRLLGGAPANFAYHVNGLGGVGVPVSRVGDDALGNEALGLLALRGVNVDAIAVDPDHPTGTVDARIDEAGVATYVFPDDVAWDFLSLDDAARGLAAKADAICFGTLAQRSENSRDAVRDFLEAAPSALKVYDINLRQDFYSADIIANSLSMADVLKINDDELALVADMFDLPSDEQEALGALFEKYTLSLAVLTRGDKGSLILSEDGVSDLSGRPTEVVDTIGAGDSFTAALVLGYLSGWSLGEINEHATRVASYVCGQAGAMPELPEDLKIL